MTEDFLKRLRDYLFEPNSKLCKIEQEIVKSRVKKYFENLKNENSSNWK